MSVWIRGRGLIRAILGWGVFLLLLALIGYVGFRTWYYVGRIKSGSILDLPQFSQNVTYAPGTRANISAKVVERSVIENPGSPAFGTANPKLTIVEFADFQCPYSRSSALIARSLMAKYGADIRFIFRNFPITEIHPDAFQAAVAAECAQEQGKFWQYHDRLFSQAASLSYMSLIDGAEAVGMNRKQFEQCLADNRYKGKVDEDIAAAKLIGLRGTPTFIFDGQIVEGEIPRDTFEQIILRMDK